SSTDNNPSISSINEFVSPAYNSSNSLRLPRYNFLTAFSARSIHPHPNKSHLIDGFKILLATLIDEQRQSYMRLSFPSAEATR
ncbi:hypothetical protein HID58_086498, partial [Brassica napus]